MNWHVATFRRFTCMSCGATADVMGGPHPQDLPSAYKPPLDWTRQGWQILICDHEDCKEALRRFNCAHADYHGARKEALAEEQALYKAAYERHRAAVRAWEAENPAPDLTNYLRVSS